MFATLAVLGTTVPVTPVHGHLACARDCRIQRLSQLKHESVEGSGNDRTKQTRNWVLKTSWFFSIVSWALDTFAGSRSIVSVNFTEEGTVLIMRLKMFPHVLAKSPLASLYKFSAPLCLGDPRNANPVTVAFPSLEKILRSDVMVLFWSITRGFCVVPSR